MEYWQGGMDWNLTPNWKCVVCKEYHGLTWGLETGECRCNHCHTPYQMIDYSNPQRPPVLTPIPLLRPEYLKAAQEYYPQAKNHLIDSWSDKTWDNALIYSGQQAFLYSLED